MLEAIQNMLKLTSDEVEKALSSRTVVGDPVTVEGITLIPLLSVGFFFGGAGGEGKSKEKGWGEGVGGGTGGGAWIKPIAIVIIDKGAIRVEPIAGGMAGAIEKLGMTVSELMEKWWERRKGGQK